MCNVAQINTIICNALGVVYMRGEVNSNRFDISHRIEKYLCLHDIFTSPEVSWFHFARSEMDTNIFFLENTM